VVQQTLGHACSTVSEVDFDTTSDETSMSFSSQTSVREFRMNHFYSIGFAPNPSVSLTSADTINGPGRLSWHMHAGFGAGGYRLGAIEGLNGSSFHAKFVLGANAPVAATPVPEPASIITWSLLGVGMIGGSWFQRRRKQQLAVC
jgi:hypothetical protein